MKRFSPYYKYLILLALFFGIGACTVKTLYDQLDGVLAGLVEDYVELTEQQDQYVAQRIANIMQWHRKTQLPLYTADLLQARHDIDTGLTFDKITAFYALINQRWISFKHRAAPDIAGLLITLSKDQQARMFAVIKQKNEQYSKKYVNITPQQRKELIGERLSENFTRWLGDVNKEQEAVLRQWVEKFAAVDQDRLEFRRAWQKELRLVLNSTLSDQEKRRELTELFRNPEQFRSQVYKDKLAYNQEQSIYMLLAISLTPKQKQYLYGRIDYYVKNFRELATE